MTTAHARKATIAPQPKETTKPGPKTLGIQDAPMGFDVSVTEVTSHACKPP